MVASSVYILLGIFALVAFAIFIYSMNNENFAQTIVVDGKQYSVCTNPAAAKTVDKLGRRWGVENNKRCYVVTPAPMRRTTAPVRRTTTPKPKYPPPGKGNTIQHGNNGTVSCDRYCNMKKAGVCVRAFDNQKNKAIKCQVVTGHKKDGSEVTCECGPRPVVRTRSKYKSMAQALKQFPEYSVIKAARKGQKAAGKSVNSLSMPDDDDDRGGGGLSKMDTGKLEAFDELSLGERWNKLVEYLNISQSAPDCPNPCGEAVQGGSDLDPNLYGWQVVDGTNNPNPQTCIHRRPCTTSAAPPEEQAATNMARLASARIGMPFCNDPCGHRERGRSTDGQTVYGWENSMSCRHIAECGGAPLSTEQTCSNLPPSNEYTCEEQAGWGKCNEPWMNADTGLCNRSCGRCDNVADLVRANFDRVADAHRGGGGGGSGGGGGFAGKSHCAAYAPGQPLPFPYNALKTDGSEGGIETRGDALVQNKKLLNDEMSAQGVPAELRPLIMAFAMIETPDLSLDQISNYMRSKTIEQGRCFGIMNINFGHRSHVGLDKALSTDALNAKTDQYYNSKDAAAKGWLAKEIMVESVKVFKTSFEQLGIYCTVLFHRGGPTLYNDPDFQKYAQWHPQIFLDSAANTYNKLVADATLMTDNRRVWYNVKEV